MAVLFNNKRHSDVTVEVTGRSAPIGKTTGGLLGSGQSETFFLHKFPLMSNSAFFAEVFESVEADGSRGGEEDGGAGGGASGPPAPISIKLVSFPGGPQMFELVARQCYGEAVDITVDNVAFLFAAARVLRVKDLTTRTEAFMVDHVLPDTVNATLVLGATQAIENQPDSVMVDLVGRCINVVASRFEPIPELQSLDPDCFACLLRTAKDLDCPKHVLQAAVQTYIDSRIDPSPAPSTLTPQQFHEIVAAPGSMDDMMHADAVYRSLEILLGEIPEGAATQLCGWLNDVGLWTCLPHAAIEAAYANSSVPDRFVTVSCMSEARHLITLNDALADQVEDLMALLRSHGIEPPPPTDNLLAASVTAPPPRP